MRQRTISNPITAKGVGLHSGIEATMTLRPAPVNTGIIFRRIDQNPVVELLVAPKTVGETTLCTTIHNKDIKVATIEHLMSALAGIGIDNLYIDIDAPEVPIMDGSASHFIFLVQAAGIEEQQERKKFIRILKPIKVENDKGGWAEFKPYNGYKLNFSISFEHPAFRETAEELSLEFSSTSYFIEVSRARTFGFMRDMEMLRSRQLALGACLDNAIGLDDEGVVNEGGLRNKDEFVRHKILDAVGDLYMAGHPIIGEFNAHKSGHALNNQLLLALFDEPDAYEIVSVSKEEVPIDFNSSKILL